MSEIYVSSSLISAACNITVQAVNQRIAKEKMEWRKRSGRGGGREYLISQLPIEWQGPIHHYLSIASPLFAAPLPASPPPKPKSARIFDPVVKAAGDAAAAQLQGNLRVRLDDRLQVLDCFTGLTASALLTAVTRYNSGEMDVPAEVRAHIPTVSLATIYRWRDQAQRLGIARIAGKFGNRAGTGLIDTQPELAAALRGLLVETPHVRPGFAREWLAARYDDRTIPSLMTIRRWLGRWKTENAELYTRLRDPDAWKGRYMLGWGDASGGILRLNQAWEFDSTPADVLLADGRHAILGVIDVYSRRLRLHVAKTSKAAAVASLLRNVLRDWGVPEVAKTDNGQEYVSNHVSRIFQALGIEQHLSAPFSPWQKPFIERAFRTFSHDLIEVLPGYAGHDVAEREALRARKQFSDRLFVKNRVVELSLTAPELQAFCDRWCAAYHVRNHAGLGRTPLEQVANWRQPVRMLDSERVLDLLLAPAPGDGWRTVGKSSGVRIDRFDFLAPELALYVNQRVRVLYDPEGDAGRVWCFSEKGDFIALAECPELTGIDRQALAAHAKQLQQQHITAAAQEARAEAKKIGARDALNAVLDARDRAARKLCRLPGPTEPHETRAIAAAQDALDAQAPRPVVVVPPEKLAELREKMERDDAERARRAERPDFDAPYARAQWLYERVLRGKVAVGEVSLEDRDWLRGYYRTEAASARNLERTMRDFYLRFDEVKAVLLREERTEEESANAGQQAG